MPKQMQPANTEPRMKWELGSRDTNMLFDAAQKKMEEQIRDMRMRLIELLNYEPIPNIYDRDSKTFQLYDHRTKLDKIEDYERWLADYERVHRFILKAKETILKYEAEQFADDMAAYFEQERSAKR